MQYQPNKSSFRRPVLSLLAGLAVALAAQESQATYMVEAGSSGTNKVWDGWCSLPEAIEAINQDKTAHGNFNYDCVNSGGGSDILLEGVSTAYYKTFGAVITKSTTISGYYIDSLALVEHDGAFTLKIEGAGPIDVYLISLHLRHIGGTSGRVIDNRSNLYMMDTVITGGNIAANSGAAADGGGIYNLGSLEMFNSTISGNAAKRGGGLFSNSAVGSAMWETTIDNNTASQQGGGIYSAGRLHAVRSTISTNVATGNGGGIYATTADNSYCELYFATVAFNRGASGGGVFVSSDSVHTNTNGSIVANNVLTNNTYDDYNGYPNRENGVVKTTNIRNLFRSSTGVLSPAPLDLFGSDPLLSALTNYGGSFTRTHPLGATSPARNVAIAGTFGNDGYDQNYNYRPPTNADLGSFEVQ